MAAWVVAALNRYNMYSFRLKDPFIIGLFVLPSIWVICVAAMLFTRKRRLVWYWWVAVSLPYIATFWLLFPLTPFWYAWGDPIFRLFAPF
ncbi:MAG: hypothetical protein ACOZHQ_10065 [Thermodesulfobacteriota bacterium]